MTQPDWDSLKGRLEANGQGHVLNWLDELSESEKGILYQDLSEIDLDNLQRYFDKAQQTMAESSEKKDERMLPLDDSICASVVKDKGKVESWNSLGLEKISRGEVGVLLMAGGQGTRLGVSYPKGMYDVGLPSHKSLYQLQAERILRLQKLARERFGGNPIIPWYIMTSEYTRETTVGFFKNHNYFGLDSQNLIVFEQNTLPCLSFEGKIIMDTKCRIARAPDGNGGLYAALVNPNRNILEDMKGRGISCVHVYGVDNILVKMADPVFVGYCSEKDADCGVKVVNKSSPDEKVGVVCLLDRKYQVVEYSEISQKTSEMRNQDGTLTFNAGNICNHYFTVSFLDGVCSRFKDQLRHHIAKKKIPFINEEGKRILPTSPNGIKMEKFVFDVFQFSQRLAVLEVLREEDFSPLKNGPESKTDSPSSCRTALMKFHYKQLVSAGASLLDENGKELPHDVNGVGVICEISPLVSYCGEGLKELYDGKTFKQPLHLEVDKNS